MLLSQTHPGRRCFLALRDILDDQNRVISSEILRNNAKAETDRRPLSP